MYVLDEFSRETRASPTPPLSRHFESRSDSLRPLCRPLILNERSDPAPIPKESNSTPNEYLHFKGGNGKKETTKLVSCWYRRHWNSLVSAKNWKISKEISLFRRHNGSNPAVCFSSFVRYDLKPGNFSFFYFRNYTCRLVMSLTSETSIPSVDFSQSDL